jgi:O-antigen/teichoic acid export membrane protein
MRLFSVVGILSGFFLPSFWTAYSEAVARGDVEWVRVALARSTKGTFAIAASLSVTIAAFGSVAIDRWLGSAVHPSVGLMLGAAVWVTMTAVGASFAMLLNGARVIRYQLVCSVFLGVSSIGLKIALGRHFGTSGIVWGNVIAYLLFVLIPLVFFLPKLFRGLRELRPDVA